MGHTYANTLRSPLVLSKFVPGATTVSVHDGQFIENTLRQLQRGPEYQFHHFFVFYTQLVRGTASRGSLSICASLHRLASTRSVSMDQYSVIRFFFLVYVRGQSAASSVSSPQISLSSSCSISLQTALGGSLSVELLLEQNTCSKARPFFHEYRGSLIPRIFTWLL